MKTSVCIDMLFPEVPFYDRFALAKRSGVDAVEFWKWTNKDIDRVESELKENDLSFSVFNLDAKDEQLSYDLSRGILNAGRRDEFLKAIEESIPVYKRLGASGMIVLVGETLDIPYEKQIENVTCCLEAAAPVLEKENITLVVEPLNDIDRKNYFLPRSKELFEIAKQVGSPNIKLLFDIYHEQLMAGNIINTLTENASMIGHFHVADVPGRHEPGTGEINYPNVFKAIESTDYSQYVGFEFRSTKNALETADFIRIIEC